MIPRLKPYLGKEEFLCAITPLRHSVEKYEAKFAQTFEANHALAFPYGRSALWAFFKAMNFQNKEIIMPAYTCVVVAHSIVLSGNRPRFVDISMPDYNMNLDQVAEAINEDTVAVIATHLFGYPLDIVKLSKIVREAENRLGRKIWVIQDCAHAFGATWKGKLVCNAGDAALYGMNISKLMTSIFGGMITTNDKELFQKIKACRDEYFTTPAFTKTLKRFLYLIAAYFAFNEKLYGFIHWLQENTPLLDRLTKAYHLDGKIHFPPNHLDLMLPIEARVGMAQLSKYPMIIKKRREAAAYYQKNLFPHDGWIMPPIVEGATYSHFVVRVPDRLRMMKIMAKNGVQLGQLIQYSIPHIPEYQKYVHYTSFPVSKLCSEMTINLPLHCHLSISKIKHISKISV